jgi:hypothetical protein
MTVSAALISGGVAGFVHQGPSEVSAAGVGQTSRPSAGDDPPSPVQELLASVSRPPTERALSELAPAPPEEVVSVAGTLHPERIPPGLAAPNHTASAPGGSALVPEVVGISSRTPGGSAAIDPTPQAGGGGPGARPGPAVVVPEITPDPVVTVPTATGPTVPDPVVTVPDPVVTVPDPVVTVPDPAPPVEATSPTDPMPTPTDPEPGQTPTELAPQDEAGQWIPAEDPSTTAPTDPS